jgi:hypothetical protein
MYYLEGIRCRQESGTGTQCHYDLRQQVTAWTLHRLHRLHMDLWGSVNYCDIVSSVLSCLGF